MMLCMAWGWISLTVYRRIWLRHKPIEKTLPKTTRLIRVNELERSEQESMIKEKSMDLDFRKRTEQILSQSTGLIKANGWICWSLTDRLSLDFTAEQLKLMLQTWQPRQLAWQLQEALLLLRKNQLVGKSLKPYRILAFLYGSGHEILPAVYLIIIYCRPC